MNVDVVSGSVAPVRLDVPPQMRTQAKSGPILAGVAVSAALGVLLVSQADVSSRASDHHAYALFWVGLSFIFLPPAWRICRSGTERNERLAIAGMFGLALYLVKCLYSPSAFIFNDEYAHLRTILNIIETGRLFGFNPEIRVASDYPGIALVTLGLGKISGLSVVSSGMVVVGAARLVLMLSLFLLLERLTGSARAAGVGCLVYAGNANFLYWDAQFAYESLALPLALATVYLLLRRSDGNRDYTAPTLLVAAMVIITHHLTSYALLALLASWTVVAIVRRNRRRTEIYVPAVPTLALALGAGLWISLVAPLTSGYILPVLSRALSQGIDLLLHQKSSRILFSNPGGAVQPHWEKMAALGAVVLVLILVPAGLVAFHHKWSHPLTCVIAWSSLLYILMLPLRFTLAGQEAANRSGEFLFVGIATLMAMILIVGGKRRGAHSRKRRLLDPDGSWRLHGGTGAVAFSVCTVMFLGGVAVSWSFAQRLPPPTRVSGVPAYPTPDVVAAANWMRSEFGPYHRVASDVTTGLAFETFGEQNVVSGASVGSHAWRIFEPQRMTTTVYRELASSKVEFVVVDKQLTQGISATAGVPVYDAGEPLTLGRKPVSQTSQAKFATAVGLSMVYTSKTITIYQVDQGQVRQLEIGK